MAKAAAEAVEDSMAEESCAEEWERAYEICRNEIYDCNNPGITGGYQDVENCTRGLVSERCGGNKVEY